MSTLDLTPLSDVFRHEGYDGASLSLIADAVGLKRASLYHRFPGGKQEMAEAVLSDVRNYFLRHVIGPLLEDGAPSERLDLALEGVRRFYMDGRKSCLIDVLSLGESSKMFQPQIAELIQAWMNAMTRVSVDSGHSETRARELAEESIIRVQGALVISRSLKDTGPFMRVLASLPSRLIA